MQQDFQVELGDDLMMQVESSPLGVMKRMSEVVTKAGEMGSLEKTVGRDQRERKDVNMGKVKSVTSHLISLRILEKRSMKEEMGMLSMVERQLEVEGGVQATRKVEELQKMLSTKRVQEENVEQEVAFLLGLMEKYHQDRA